MPLPTRAARRALGSLSLFSAVFNAYGEQAHTGALLPAERPVDAIERRVSALEFNWTPLKMRNGDRLALLGASYLVASPGRGWGIGPAVYGAAQGDYGGLFTAGFNVQGRWRLASNWHAAASLYAGAGGGISSPQASAGGGLMLRPELSLRREFGAVYAGVGVAHVRFPSGNIQDTQWTVVIGRIDRFMSFLPSHAGQRGRASTRTGLEFDEISLHAGAERLGSSSRMRSGRALNSRLHKAGADLRYYWTPASWWSVEASGATSGGVDGYMEILAGTGADWALWSDRLRLGAQVAAGLGGGGDVDTGSGWLLRAGPALRWITPWGPTLRVEGGYTTAPGGHYDARQLRLSLSLPLESTTRRRSAQGDEAGAVRRQTWYATVPHFRKFTFKDGSHDAVTGLGMAFTRDLAGPWYGVGQAGSAAWGKAGAFSYGLFGVGAQTSRLAGGWRLGAEALVGAAGGGGVAVGGGGVAQSEAWAQWEGAAPEERLRLKIGVGRWQGLAGERHATPMLSLAVGWAFGTLGP